MLTKAEVARLRSLHEKKNREAEKVFVVEGEKVVRELLEAGFPFLEVYGTSQAVAAEFSGKVRLITTLEMARISHFPTPSSLFALGRLERHTLGENELDTGLTLALDGVQDAGNVGTLLRLADWFGATRVLLSPDSADLFSQKVINASMGSFARVRVVTAELADALERVRVPVLGCDLSGDDIHGVDVGSNVVVVIGSEGRGLSVATRPRITRFVTIPRRGAAESLNAAVAAGIVLDNLIRAAR
ncbi:MAG TPA: RNA methyltransferase [Opitutaceae bacterium]|nr:RNA methyltransferase [Opitutaceae bacterium]